MSSVKCNTATTFAGLEASLAVCILLCVSTAAAQDAVEFRHVPADDVTSNLYAEVRGKLVTLDAREVSMREVLDIIARDSGLIVHSDAPLTDPVTINFENQTLDEALGRILGARSYLLLAHADDSSRSTLWVFAAKQNEWPDRSSTSHHFQSTLAELQASLLSGNPHARYMALKGLRKLEGESVVASIGLALTDEDRKIRVRAIYALADIGGNDAAAALAAASVDENPYVRAESAYALGMIGGDTAVRILEHALLDPSLDVRQSAVEAFGDIGTEQAALALGVALQYKDASLRLDTVDALTDIGGETAIHLLNLALQDPDIEVRQAANAGLAELSRPEL